MQCIRCHKPLKAFTRQVADAEGHVWGWGPRCSLLAFGPMPKSRREKVARSVATVRVEDGQVDWLEQVMA